MTQSKAFFEIGKAFCHVAMLLDQDVTVKDLTVFCLL